MKNAKSIGCFVAPNAVDGKADQRRTSTLASFS